MNAWRLSDYLINAWQLPDDCLTTAWRLPDDCLTTAWRIPIPRPRKNNAQNEKTTEKWRQKLGTFRASRLTVKKVCSLNFPGPWPKKTFIKHINFKPLHLNFLPFFTYSSFLYCYFLSIPKYVAFFSQLQLPWPSNWAKRHANLRNVGVQKRCKNP